MRSVIKEDLLRAIQHRRRNRTHRTSQMSLSIGINVSHAAEDNPLNCRPSGISGKTSPI
jgi:hypothetical protein